MESAGEDCDWAGFSMPYSSDSSSCGALHSRHYVREAPMYPASSASWNQTDQGLRPTKIHRIRKPIFVVRDRGFVPPHPDNPWTKLRDAEYSIGQSHSSWVAVIEDVRTTVWADLENKYHRTEQEAITLGRQEYDRWVRFFVRLGTTTNPPVARKPPLNLTLLAFEAFVDQGTKNGLDRHHSRSSSEGEVDLLKLAARTKSRKAQKRSLYEEYRNKRASRLLPEFDPSEYEPEQGALSTRLTFDTSEWIQEQGQISSSSRGLRDKRKKSSSSLGLRNKRNKKDFRRELKFKNRAFRYKDNEAESSLSSWSPASSHGSNDTLSELGDEKNKNRSGLHTTVDSNAYSNMNTMPYRSSISNSNISAPIASKARMRAFKPQGRGQGGGRGRGSRRFPAENKPLEKSDLTVAKEKIAMNVPLWELVDSPFDGGKRTLYVGNLPNLLVEDLEILFQGYEMSVCLVPPMNKSLCSRYSIILVPLHPFLIVIT